MRSPPEGPGQASRRGLAAAAVGGGGTEGPGCGGRGRRRGLAGLRNRPRSRQARVWQSHGRAAAHGRTKQPSPTAGSNNTWNTSYTRNTSGPLPPPTDTAHRCRPRAHQAARPHRHAPPDTRPETRHQARAQKRARNTSGPTNTHQKQQKAGRNLSVPARPRYSATIGATRQVALRGRWCHATGEHQCATAVSCQ